MAYLADTGLPESVRWFLQFSRSLQKIHCTACGGVARGIVYYTLGEDGKSKRRTRNDDESIIHSPFEGEGNRLTHKRDCFVLAEIIKVVGGEAAQVLASQAIINKIVTRKCGCMYKRDELLATCNKHKFRKLDCGCVYKNDNLITGCPTHGEMKTFQPESNNGLLF